MVLYTLLVISQRARKKYIGKHICNVLRDKTETNWSITCYLSENMYFLFCLIKYWQYNYYTLLL